MKRIGGIFSLMILILGLALFVVSFNEHANENGGKINGLSLVAPRNQIGDTIFEPILASKANYVAVIPYAFSKSGQPSVTFEYDRQWWGEKQEGVRKTIEMAQKSGLKVMIKPHVWVLGEGWPGDYSLASDREWLQWEVDYKKYILAYAAIAEAYHVELFCIGTEFRQAVKGRPKFWRQLIKDVRSIYKGKVTYAANWDNYENVTFWQDLDFIGIDAYFPLSQTETPGLAELRLAWEPVKSALNGISTKYSKPILFTEFGYQSIDYTAMGHWEKQIDTLAVNHAGQVNAYKAVFDSFWHEDWFAGGFVWKWHCNHKLIGGEDCKQFTPQNKAAQEVLKQYFERIGLE